MTAVDSSTDSTNESATTTILSPIQKACANLDAKQLEWLRILLEEEHGFPKGSARALLVAFNLGVARRVLIVLALHRVLQGSLVPRFFEGDTFTLKITLYARTTEPFSSDIQLVLAAWDICQELKEKRQLKKLKSVTEYLQWSVRGFNSTRAFIDQLWSALLSAGLDRMGSQRQEATIREIAACLLTGFPDWLLCHSPANGWTPIRSQRTHEVLQSNLEATGSCGNQLLLVSRAIPGKRNKPGIATELTRIDYKLLMEVYPESTSVTTRDYRYDAQNKGVTRSMALQFNGKRLPETRVLVEGEVDSEEAHQVTATLARAMLSYKILQQPAVPLSERLRDKEDELNDWLQSVNAHPVALIDSTMWAQWLVKVLNGATTVQAVRALPDEVFNPTIEDIVSMLLPQERTHVRNMQGIFPAKITTASGDTLAVTYHRADGQSRLLETIIDTNGSDSAMANLRDDDIPAGARGYAIYIVHTVPEREGGEQSAERFQLGPSGVNGIRRRLAARQQSLFTDKSSNAEVRFLTVEQPGQEQPDKILLFRNPRSGDDVVWLNDLHLSDSTIKKHVTRIAVKFLGQYTDEMAPAASIVDLVTNKIIELTGGDYSALPESCSEKSVRSLLQTLEQEASTWMQNTIWNRLQTLWDMLPSSVREASEFKQLFIQTQKEAGVRAPVSVFNIWKTITLFEATKNKADQLVTEWGKIALHL